MTTSIEDAFGSRLMTAAGFLLNNQLTDFSDVAEVAGRPVANRIEGGKRPRSSMAPTIVLDCTADTQYDKVHPAASKTHCVYVTLCLRCSGATSAARGSASPAP